MFKLLESLEQEGVLKTKINYLTAKNNIGEAFPKKNERKVEEDIEFYAPQDIKNLFSGRLVFKTTEEAKILPLICSFSFFCMMKQGEIAKLKISDVDIENKRVRNIKTVGNEQTNLAEWINLEDITYGYLVDYLKFRESLKVNAEELMVTEGGTPISNKDFNRIFSSVRREENKTLLNGKIIKQELLIRSMMLYILTSTKGQGLYDIMLTHQPKNRQFIYAFKEYLSSMRDQYSNDSVDSYSLTEIVPKRIEMPILQESKNDNDVVMGMYSEENDINEVDLRMYDEGNVNNRNLEEGKVTIQRMVRNSKIAENLKAKYDNRCQLCNTRMRKSNGDFKSEAHHIQPYNKTYRGDDNYQNMIVVCPNCHSQFDDSYYAIHPKTLVVHCIFEEEDKLHFKKLSIIDGHILGKRYLEFAWKQFEEKKSLKHQ